MEAELHEKYEYARARIHQKKWLLYHFVFFLLGSFFFFVANHFLQLGGQVQWYQWVVAAWFFVFLLHFIKVYVTDRFMNKNWERAQIERLIKKQEQKLAVLENKISSQTPQN